jgi:hypothetical protein
MNEYLQILQKISLDNKYFRIYCSIIDRAIKRQAEFSTILKYKIKNGYAEKHHILPKSFKMGGVSDALNIVFLSAREHFIVHKLLIKFSKNNLKFKMLEALSYFSNNAKRKLTFTSHDYSLLKESNSLASSIRNKGNKNYLHRNESEELSKKKSFNAKSSKWINDGINESFVLNHHEMVKSGKWIYGRLKMKEQIKKKISQSLIGVTLNKKRSIEQRKNISDARKKINEEKRNAGIKITVDANTVIKKCEKCGILTNSGNYGRWHGPKCKK